MDTGSWCLIESDPGVFTELIKGFGCTGVQAEEIFSLDDDQFDNLKPIYGLIFLFKWKPDSNISQTVVSETRDSSHVYFAQQIINNACATQAIISILLNCDSIQDVDIGPALKDFKSFSANFDPHMRGLSLSNLDQVREIHNSFSRQSIFQMDEKIQDKDDDLFHFISFVPVDGYVYELDGLKQGPVCLGAIPEASDWMKVVKPVLQTRMTASSTADIHFNLLALTEDKFLAAKKRLEELSKTPNPDASQSEYWKTVMQEQEKKNEQYRVENIRRKHNYLPFIMELLKILAQENKLSKLVQTERLRLDEEKKS